MSFILDALKKAESERNRRIAPVLMDARIAPPRRGLPGWALALGVVLLLNLGVVSWLLLRKQEAPATAAGEDPVAATAAPSTVPVMPASPASAATSPLPPAANPGTAQDGQITNGPAVEAPGFGPAAAAATTDSDSLPTLQDLRSAGIALPELQLNLHVYDPAPSHRSVLLNGQRMREGEYTGNGVKLESITPAGVVLEASGRRFRMDAGG